jgi:hypothetical protein
MKTDVSSTIVHSEGFQSESFFSIKQDNLAHIFGILRNQLYSNKPLAVIREYCTNAFDAHVDAGKADEPIIVNDEEYYNPMASFSFLSDQQIAAVLTYIRTRFNNKSTSVSVQEVSLVRKQLAVKK